MEDTKIVQTFENHEMRLQRHEERLNNLEQVQTQLKDLTLTVHDLTLSNNRMIEEFSTVKTAVEEIEKEPVEKYKWLVKTVASCVITLIVTTILTIIISNLM